MKSGMGHVLAGYNLRLGKVSEEQALHTMLISKSLHLSKVEENSITRR